MRLQTKTLGLFVLSGMLILALVGLIQFMVLQSRTLEGIAVQVGRQLEHLDFALTRFLQDVEHDLRVLAADPRVRTLEDENFTSFLDADEKTFQYQRGPLEKEIVDLFQTFRHIHPHVHSVYMGRENGSFVRSHPRNRPTQYDPRRRPWYVLARDNPGRVLRTPPYRSVTAPDVNIGVVTSLEDDAGRFLGVLGADITLAGLTEYLTDFALSHGGRMLLVDQEGVILAAPDKDMFFVQAEEVFPGILTPIETGGEPRLILNGPRGRVHAYIHRSSETGWTLAALVDDARVRREVRTVVVLNLGFLAGAIVLLSLVILAGLYRFVLQPVGELTTGTDHVRKTENLGFRFSRTGRDEIGRLAQAFNEMLAALEAAESQLLASHNALERERNALDAKVVERTRELKEQNQALGRAMEQVQKAQDHLVVSEKMAALGVLAAGVAHEINNPVNFIKTSMHGLEKDIQDLMRVVDFCRNKIDPDHRPDLDALAQEIELPTVCREIPELLSHCFDGLRRTEDIVRSLRTFVRTDDAMDQAVDICQVIDSALVILHNRVKHRVQVEVLCRDLPSVCGNAGKLGQVVLNILTNALDAMEENDEAAPQKISIRAEVVSRWNKEWVAVFIQDTGPGISSENMRCIFDPFFSTKDVGKGTGLGLYIARTILQEHQGFIQAQSTPGHGAVFSLLLPIKE